MPDPDILDSGGGRWWQDDDGVDGGGVRAPRPERRRGGDEPAGPERTRRPPGTSRRRRTIAALVVAALLLGIAVGALSQRALRERADQAADRAVVDLRLTDEQPVTTQRRAEWALELALNNAGPLPVHILDARVDGPGVVSDPPPEQVQVASDGRVQVLVRGTLDCGAVDETGARTFTDTLALTVAVRTADGARHDVDLGPARTGSGRQRIADSCAELARGSLAAVGPLGERPRTVEARLQLQLRAAAGVRIDGVRLSPPGAFRVAALGLPMRLTDATPGQFSITVRVAGCARALAYSPATARVDLQLSGVFEQALGLAVPRDLGDALIRLSKRSCLR